MADTPTRPVAHRKPAGSDPAHAPGEELFSLWQRVAAFPASQAEAALRHLMEWIASAISADNIVWIGATRALEGEAAEGDPFFGWRLRVRLPMRPDPKSYQRVLKKYYSPEHYGKLTPTYRSRSHSTKMDHVGMTGRASLAGAGRFRVHCMRDPDWIDFRAFQRTAHYKMYYAEPGIIDRMTIGFPVSPKCESFFLADRFRTGGRRFFTPEDARLAGDASRGVPELHRRLFLGNGLWMGDKPFSPMERQILNGLLDGRTEKEIAVSVGQKFDTTHKYVRTLYARFGVTSRASLMALWLGAG